MNHNECEYYYYDYDRNSCDHPDNIFTQCNGDICPFNNGVPKPNLDLMKKNKKLWDTACDLEFQFGHGLKSFVQNPIELTEEDFDIFQKRYTEYIINLDRWMFNVIRRNR